MCTTEPAAAVFHLSFASSRTLFGCRTTSKMRLHADMKEESYHKNVDTISLECGDHIAGMWRAWRQYRKSVETISQKCGECGDHIARVWRQYRYLNSAETILQERGDNIARVWRQYRYRKSVETISQECGDLIARVRRPYQENIACWAIIFLSSCCCVTPTV